MESILVDIDEMILQKNQPPFPSYSRKRVTTLYNKPTNTYHIPVHPIVVDTTTIDPFDNSLNSTVCTENHSLNSTICTDDHSPISNISNVSNRSNASYNSSQSRSPSISVSNSCRNNLSYNDIIHKFEPLLDSKLQLKHYVFISRDSTQKLSDYIVSEHWGNTYSLLYKYLDYIFRCQLFSKSVIQINDIYTLHPKYLIFNTGLQRRQDNQILYAIFTPNNIINAQPWRVPFGHIKHSFASKNEIINKLLKYNIKISIPQLPKRTKFYSSLTQILYDSSYAINANWEERLTTNKDRIFNVIGSAAFFDDNCKFLKLTELIQCFIIALPKTRNIAELNPRLAVPQAFVDTKHSKYRLELLLPIIVTFPKYNGNDYKFVLAIDKSDQIRKTYVIKSLLTMDMAYANARLVGYVDSLWLHSP
eukprot:756653_1